MPAPIPPSAPPTAPARDLAAAARAFEASFLAEMLKSAGVFDMPQEFGGGEGEAQFTSFLADEQARAIVERGGLGLAPAVERALRARAEGVGAPEQGGGA